VASPRDRLAVSSRLVVLEEDFAEAWVVQLHARARELAPAPVRVAVGAAVGSARVVATGDLFPYALPSVPL